MLNLRTGTPLPLQWQKPHSFGSSQPLHLSLPQSFPLKILSFIIKSNQNERIVKPNKAGQNRQVLDNKNDDDEEASDEDEHGSGPYSRFKERAGDQDYDKDPEFAEILSSYMEDPQKGQARLEDRVRRKRNKIVHTKTGSATPMKVIFNKFDYSNSYIWFEFYRAPLSKDITLLCDTIGAWHIVGRLGGCNSMNLQLLESPLNKRPSYDAIQGANVTPTAFYNIGDLEVQDNLARIWVDIGEREPLLLDVLINALTQISSDHFGIKKVVFGGMEHEDWRENLTSEDAGCSVHKI